MATPMSETKNKCRFCNSIYKVSEVEPGVICCRGFCLIKYKAMAAKRDQMAVEAKWKVGDFTRAVWVEDGVEYEGTIDSLDENDGRPFACVTFLGYGNNESIWVDDLMKSQGNEARDAQIAAAAADEAAAAAVEPEWKVGDFVNCKSDGEEDFEGKILSVDESDGNKYVLVEVVGSGETQSVWWVNLSQPKSQPEVKEETDGDIQPSDDEKPRDGGWKVGDHCRVVYELDGLEYECKIESLFSGSDGQRMANVRAYGMKCPQKCPLSEIKDSLGRDARKKQAEKLLYKHDEGTAKEEEAKRVREEAAAKKARDEAEAKKVREEAAAKKAREEAEARKVREAAAAKKAKEEAAEKKAREEAAAKKAREEAAAKKAREEAAAKKAREEAAAKKAKEEAAAKEKEAKQKAEAEAKEEEAKKKAEAEAKEKKAAKEEEERLDAEVKRIQAEADAARINQQDDEAEAPPSQYKVGDAVRAIYSEDNIEYEGDIMTMASTDEGHGYVIVKFVGYGNEETVWECDLLPSHGPEARLQQENAATSSEPQVDSGNDSSKDEGDSAEVIAEKGLDQKSALEDEIARLNSANELLKGSNIELFQKMTAAEEKIKDLEKQLLDKDQKLAISMQDCKKLLERVENMRSGLSDSNNNGSPPIIEMPRAPLGMTSGGTIAPMMPQMMCPTGDSSNQPVMMCMMPVYMPVPHQQQPMSPQEPPKPDMTSTPTSSRNNERVYLGRGVEVKPAVYNGQFHDADEARRGRNEDMPSISRGRNGYNPLRRPIAKRF